MFTQESMGKTSSEGFMQQGYENYYNECINNNVTYSPVKGC